MTALGKDWCILRCSGAKTLKLAASLGASGFDVWTPVETLRKREGKSRSRRADILPVMPSYVFARAAHLVDLIEESALPYSEHPEFSVFHYHARIPLIADEALDPLRVAERRRQPFGKVARFTRGEMVRLMEGGFAGLTGVVELTRGQYTLVTFPGFPMPIKISTLLLKVDMAKGGLPYEGAAVKQAA